MTTSQGWIPPDVDESAPSGARIYDYLLGGSHNFAVDRVAAEKTIEVMPGIQQAVRVNRAFLGRVVRYMIDQGVRQFLDLGSGIPTVGNVHQVAQSVDPSCRVVYVDRDRIAVAHSELMLAGNDHAEVVLADVRDTDSVLNSPQVRRLLNFDEPVGLLCLLLLHWIPDDDDPRGLMDVYRGALSSGSHLAITHGTPDAQKEQIDGVAAVIERSNADGSLFWRSYEEILAFFGDYELLEPGLVATGHWRPARVGDFTKDPEMDQVSYAGVAVKP
nr:SAM-dependent methyltransferase [Kibdelosporangium sp. MJ126-NF4]CEL23246.1 hypothetical protein [Kibdelosporangium sp. MJ126-NF4]CTQ94408.1 hypothetical protein [Kibdelosporangium sp. MJ126-NF4]